MDAGDATSPAVSALPPGMQQAVAALGRGDVEPVVALMDADVDWRGPTQGHLWWRTAPGCRGRDDVRANLERLVSGGGARVTIDAVEQVGRHLVVAGTRTEPGADANGFFQVVTVRDGRIVAMRGCRSRRQARRLARH